MYRLYNLVNGSCGLLAYNFNRKASTYYWGGPCAFHPKIQRTHKWGLDSYFIRSTREKGHKKDAWNILDQQYFDISFVFNMVFGCKFWKLYLLVHDSTKKSLVRKKNRIASNYYFILYKIKVILPFVAFISGLKYFNSDNGNLTQIENK